MKWLLAIFASLSIVTVGRAQTIDAYGNSVKLSYVNTITNATPLPVLTNYTANPVNHTFHLVGTNAFQYCLQRSIDQTNWYIGATNAVAANTVTEATVTGKYNYFRVNVQGTNVGLTINYFGE